METKAAYIPVCKHIYFCSKVLTWHWLGYVGVSAAALLCFHSVLKLYRSMPEAQIRLLLYVVYMSHWHWSCSAGGYSAAAVYAGVLQYDVWLWNMLDIHCPCLFNHLLWSEKPPFESKGKQCDFRHGSILWFSLQPLLHRQNPLHLLKLGKGNAEGHSQRLFMELLWCADWQLIFPRYNVKLWATRWTLRRATCELCCLVIPPLAAVEMWGGSLYCTAGIRPQLSCQNKCSSQEKTTLSDTLCCSAAGLNVISTLYGFKLCCRTLYDNFNIYLINY